MPCSARSRLLLVLGVAASLISLSLFSARSGVGGLPTGRSGKSPAPTEGASAEAKEVRAPVLTGRRPASETAAVLQPFTVLSLTPTKRGKAGAARLELVGHEAITLTFSHAVIALGSDFSAGPLPKELTPFQMTPPVAGRVRWVTTSVVRFDPEGEWPPELELSLSLTPGLSTFDGRVLARNEPSAWQFRTPALSMRVGRVSSARASELTGRTWSAALHPLAPGAVEVPPDATFELHFSGDVEARRVSASLELHIDEAAALVSGAATTNLRGPASASPGAPRTIVLRACPRASARCVLAEVRPPLAVGRLFRLTLPVGAVVHASAGATHAATAVSLSGLVPFAFPFRPLEHVREYSRPSYRRHHLWLRHGLEANTSLDLLAAQLQLEISSPATSPATSAATSAASPAHLAPPRTLPLRLSRPAAAVLRIEVRTAPRSAPTLRPHPCPRPCRARKLACQDGALVRRIYIIR